MESLKHSKQVRGGLRYFKIPPNTTDRVFVHMRYMSPLRRIMGLILLKAL
jgi:hypothetical protein